MRKPVGRAGATLFGFWALGVLTARGADSPLLNRMIRERVRSDARLYFPANTFKAAWENFIASTVELQDPRHRQYTVDLNTQRYEHHSVAQDSSSLTTQPLVLEEARFVETLKHDLFSPETQAKAQELFGQFKRFSRLVQKYSKEATPKENLFAAAETARGSTQNYIYSLQVKYKITNKNKAAFAKTFTIPSEGSFDLSVPFPIEPGRFDPKIAIDPRASYAEVMAKKARLRELTDSKESAQLLKEITAIEARPPQAVSSLELEIPLASQFTPIASRLQEMVSELSPGYQKNWAGDLLDRLATELNADTATQPSPIAKEKKARDGVKENLDALYLNSVQFIVLNLIPLLQRQEKIIDRLYSFFTGLNDLIEESRSLDGVKEFLSQQESSVPLEAAVGALDTESAIDNLRHALSGRLLERVTAKEITPTQMLEALGSFESDPSRFLKR